MYPYFVLCAIQEVFIMKQNKLFYLLLFSFYLIFAHNLIAKDTRDYNIKVINDIKFETNGSSLVLINEHDSDDYIEISRNADLYVNGEKVALSSRQRRLVQRYYDTYFELMEEAEKIGRESAKIGVAGAKVGAKAAAKAVMLIFSDEDMEDFEEEIEDEKELIEELAEELEERVDEIEYIADEFEDLHHQMQHEIPQLDELRWF